MTLFSYEIFDAVARQGSFNKAAQQLHLTPSAISHAIAVMEAELPSGRCSTATRPCSRASPA